MFDLAFWTSLFSIFIINVVLSGDNAVVIALASRKLPADKQKKAVFWGSFGAIGLRIILTFAAVSLLKIPFLQFIGGLLLIWIAYKLLNDNHDDEDQVQAAEGLGKAIQTVIIADLVMSLDNVLAIAGIAGGNYWLVVIGLALSIPLIVWGSNILMKLMDKFPIIIWGGAGLLAWTAGEMINKDDVIKHYLHPYIGSFHWIVPLVLTVGVIGISYLRQKKDGGSSDDEGKETTGEQADDPAEKQSDRNERAQG
ncbi:MAG TPA: TerC family protein [Bacillales bacterium]|nr:TerC family protein [Bacillales bacterium]